MAEGRNCRKTAGGRLEHGVIKLFATGLGVGCYNTADRHTQYMSSTLGVLFHLVLSTVKTQWSLQGTALHITVRGMYSYRCAVHGCGNSALFH